MSKLGEFIKACEEAEKDPNVYVDFRGQRFTQPFKCLCCGRVTSLAQWCYGRTCGDCDSGACHTDPRYRHAPYSRLDGDGHCVDFEGKLLAPLSPDALSPGIDETTGRNSPPSAAQGGATKQ